MAEKSNEVAAILGGMAVEMAGELRRHFEGLKNAPVVSEAAATDRMAKAIAAVGRAVLIVRAVAAAEDKHEEERTARRSARMDQMEMDDITPAELEQRAEELRARFDRVMARLEAKGAGPALVRRDDGGAGYVDDDSPRRAA